MYDAIAYTIAAILLLLAKLCALISMTAITDYSVCEIASL